jgi:hypothetical protein
MELHLIIGLLMPEMPENPVYWEQWEAAVYITLGYECAVPSNSRATVKQHDRYLPDSRGYILTLPAHSHTLVSAPRGTT